MRSKVELCLISCAACALMVSSAAPATAQVACTTLGAQPIVFIENGDTQEPLVKRLGARLINSSSPVRLVYKNRRTCDLALDMYVNNPIVNDAIPIRYIPSATEDPAWTPLSPSKECLADAGGNTISLGIGATFLSSCTFVDPKPADLKIINGPIQAYGFIAPTGSSQVAITAQEGYFAYGFVGNTGQAMPWIDQALRYSRGPTASTALTLAAALGLKASQLKGTVPAGNTSTEIISFVASATNADATIGLMGTEVYDSARNQVKLLAFKGYGQRFAYYPDFGATSFDKKNVRDGHYLPWAPTPYITRVDGTGKANDPNVQRLIDLVIGVRSDPDVSGIDQVIASGLVPECAMSVQRTFDGGQFSLYASPEPCACYFDAKVPQGTTKCAKCTGTGTSTCTNGGMCRRGYCEAR